MTTIIADSSQLTCFDECPVKWYYKYHEQIVKTQRQWVDSEGDDGVPEIVLPEKGKPKLYYNYRDMGTVMHKIMDYRYKYKLSIRECLMNAFLDCEQLEEPIKLGDHEKDLVIQTATLYDINYTVKSDFQVPNPETVEVGFSEEIYNDGNNQFILEGRIDLAEAFIGQTKVVVDHKSQGRVKNLYKKSIQFRNYAMIMKVSMLIINYIRFNKNPTKDTFVRDISSFTAVEHNSWRVELINLFKRIADFKNDINLCNDNYHLQLTINEHKRRSSCGGHFGYPCEDTDLCDEPNQAILINIKSMNYEKKDPFKPW